MWVREARLPRARGSRFLADRTHRLVRRIRIHNDPEIGAWRLGFDLVLQRAVHEVADVRRDGMLLELGVNAIA